jgi:uncharacterized membrane protein HdeD (DUF308 family)
VLLAPFRAETGDRARGLCSIVVGSLLVAFPGAGLLSRVWLVGFWAVVFGTSGLGLAYRLHGLDRDLNKRPTLNELSSIA